jgi:hypothetical protein
MLHAALHLYNTTHRQVIKLHALLMAKFSVWVHGFSAMYLAVAATTYIPDTVIALWKFQFKNFDAKARIQVVIVPEF